MSRDDDRRDTRRDRPARQRVAGAPEQAGRPGPQDRGDQEEGRAADLRAGAGGGVDKTAPGEERGAAARGVHPGDFPGDHVGGAGAGG